MPPATLPDDLVRALRNRMGYKDESLPELLRSIEAALHEGELKEGRALKLAQELNRHMLKLKLIGTT